MPTGETKQKAEIADQKKCKKWPEAKYWQAT